MSLLIVLADTTTNGTTLAQCIANAETYHGILALATFGKVGEELTHYHEGITIIEIITVQDGEWLLDNILTHQNGMVGTPRLLTTLRNGESLRQCIQALETEFAGNMTFILGKNLCAELILKVTTYNPNDLSKSSLDGIIDAIVHNTLSLRT